MGEPAPVLAQDTATALLPGSPGIDPGGIFVLLVTLLVFLLPVFLIFPPVLPSRTDAILQTHTRIGLDPHKSKLKTALAAANASPPSSSASPPRLRSLWIYPVKSCAGTELARAKVVRHGLEHDRLFIFAQLQSPFPAAVDAADAPADDHRWDSITHRQFPRLATVQADLYAPDAAKAARTDELFLVLRFPWRDAGLAAGAWAWAAAKLARGRHAVPEREVVLPVALPLEKHRGDKGYVLEEVSVWGKTVRALNMEVELPPELRLYLGVSNRLGIFRMLPAAAREVQRCVPSEAEAGYQPNIFLQDAYPLRLLNLTSVRDFDERVPKDEIPKELDPRRFRANIVVDGAPAYDEHSWKKIRFRFGTSSRHDKPAFLVSCRTTRCKLRNTYQDTGVGHLVEPNRSLRAHRDVDAGAKYAGCMGMQLTPLLEDNRTPVDMETWLETGMSVEVLERDEHSFRK